MCVPPERLALRGVEPDGRRRVANAAPTARTNVEWNVFRCKTLHIRVFPPGRLGDLPLIE